MACGLSKSRLLAYRQCPKRLWLQVHRPDLQEVSGQAAMAFGHGHSVGAVAQALQPDGILIETDNLSEALAATRRVIVEQPDRPIFEATFEHEGLLIRADVMTPEAGGYRMTEVKASTRVKDYHLIDSAIQTWVCRQAGVPITRTELAHVETGFVYPGNEDYRGLFNPVDVSAEIEPILTEVPGWVADAQRLLAGDEPGVETGPHCHAPFDCPFLSYCTRDQAAFPSVKYPVASLPNGGQRIASLLAEGYVDVRDVPPERLASPRHQRIQRVALSETAELDPVVGQTLRNLSYPRYYLDFESIQFAVPIWPGTRPYQQLVFQWSCHTELQTGQLEQAEFLGDSGQDPRRAFTERLITTLGEHGPVFVYNQGFEGGCLRQLAEAYPDLATPLLAIRDRLVDLLPLARNHYYHPDMQGSWSIKAVLPTVAPDLAYENLSVQHGGMAQQAYLELIEPDTTPERREELRQGLLAYCGLDTLALVRLAWYFEGRPAASQHLQHDPARPLMPKEDYAYSLQRLFELLRLIPKHPVQRTISQLQEELSEVLGEPVDKRWMERSLQMLKEHFPIYVNDKSRPYGWRWEKGASFDIPGMTLSEAQTLALAEQHLKTLLPKTIRDSLQGLFGQALKQLGMPQHHPRGRRSWLDKVRSVPAWQPLLEPSVDEATRDTVYQALHTNRPFRAGYQKPWQDEPVEYIIHPLGLVQRGQILYLVCVMEEFDDLRLLCLHRIRTAKLLDEPLRTPPGFDLDKAIAGGLFGMGGSNESIRLVARFYKPVAMHLLDTPLAEDQVIEEVDDHHLQLTATVSHTAQLQWWLQSFASEVEVLEPQELREAMAEQAEWLARKYRGRLGWSGS